jgi:hypothetical protein
MPQSTRQSPSLQRILRVLPEQALPWKTADMKILAVDIGGTFIKYAEVVACKYGNDANLVGALFTYMDSYADN